MKHVGMYIHIPFCKRKCSYCDFYSCDNKQEIIPEYIKYLKQELKEVGVGIKLDAQQKINEDVTIDTIYIGGGTPSYIDSKYIIEILDIIKSYFNIEKNVEITIEINPGTINEEKLKDYKKTGINRCSIGLQSANNELLKTLGRIHNVDEFMNTYNLAKKVGFNNINIDFIIGIPGQTLDDIEDMLDLINKINPEHVSVYSLILEDETKLTKQVEDGIYNLPEEEHERQMYWKVKNILEKMEYHHYEISNFAKKGYESKHNLDCWNQKEYIGFGVGAHSYTDNVRYSNISNIEEYILNFKNEKQEDNIIFHEKQNPYSKMQEYMMLGLRKIDGIDLNSFNEKFGMDAKEIFKEQISKLIKDGLIEIDENNIKLTNKGIDLANIVWEEFV